MWTSFLLTENIHLSLVAQMRHVMYKLVELKILRKTLAKPYVIVVTHMMILITHLHQNQINMLQKRKSGLGEIISPM